MLVLPTTTHLPFQHRPDLPIHESVLRGWDMLGNNPAFNVSGHPALSMPAAAADGLPVGVMVVGRRHDDLGVLRVAAAYESAHGWQPLREPVPAR